MARGRRFHKKPSVTSAKKERHLSCRVAYAGVLLVECLFLSAEYALDQKQQKEKCRNVGLPGKGKKEDRYGVNAKGNAVASPGLFRLGSPQEQLRDADGGQKEQ